ncbi:fasciclin domain-containing protein [Parabacteroides sp. FAFU027]|uniref:fasciclin domain-containing protein n=1 Tax=Parabacteroides sp. FAFU027 TaxID=2922715 RepID=UPI001FAF42E1|nr:fasciclin domain-containing protein [Parabacteroides sp. FAFU027]
MKAMRTPINKSITRSFISLLSFGILLAFAACTNPMDNKTFRTADTQMLDEYMADANNNLTDFLKIVDKADYRGMLHAYGTYTVFAPDNSAVQDYLQKTGKTLENLTKQEAAAIVGYHVVNDTISTSDFAEGRLSAQNIQKEYLLTHTTTQTNGNISYLVNRSATIIDRDERLGNGILHTLDKVLIKPNTTVAGTIDALPDADYSFMKQLVKDTHFDQVLANDSNKYTFIMQKNSVFAALGINSKDSLINRLRKNTPEITNTDSLLLQFIQYHCIPQRTYIRDFLISSALSTMAPKQVLSFKMSKDSILINEFIIGQLNEKGIQLDRTGVCTDVLCSNGVVQEALGQLEVKKRKPYRVYWDFADQPEIKALKGYRKVGTSVPFSDGELSEMRWGGKGAPKVTYYVGGWGGVKGQWVNGDQLTFRLDPGVLSWMEIKLPLLITGKYKVWFCWRRANPGTFRTTFKQDGEDDQVLPTVFNLEDYMPMPTTDGSNAEGKNTTNGKLDFDKQVQQGWKTYTPKYTTSVFCSKLLGTIKVTSTGRHTLRLDALTTSKGDGNYFDMIQLIPEDEDQVWPMISADGTLVNKDTPYWQIYPYEAEPAPVETPAP